MDILVNRSTKRKIGNMQLDATLSENVLYQNSITKYPVEGGLTSGVNVRPEPVEITINGIVTNSPINNENEPLTTEDNGNRVLIAHNEFLKYGGFDIPKNPGGEDVTGNDPVLVDIVSNLQVYTNMLLKNYNPIEGKKNSLKFSATFQKFTIIETDFTTVERVKDVGVATKMKNRIQNKKKVGKKQSKKDPNQSIATSLFNLIKESF